MQIKIELNCPLDKFRPCRGLECAWFTQLRGTNPNTGKDVDEWGCAMAWLPVLLVENAQKSRETGAAVESFRNVMIGLHTQQLPPVLAAPNGPHAPQLAAAQAQPGPPQLAHK